MGHKIWLVLLVVRVVVEAMPMYLGRLVVQEQPVKVTLVERVVSVLVVAVVGLVGLGLMGHTHHRMLGLVGLVGLESHLRLQEHQRLVVAVAVAEVTGLRLVRVAPLVLAVVLVLTQVTPQQEQPTQVAVVVVLRHRTHLAPMVVQPLVAQVS